MKRQVGPGRIGRIFGRRQRVGGRYGGRRGARLHAEVLETRSLLTAGFLDPTFGVNGQVLTDFAGSFDSAWDMAIQADGKIVAVGRTSSGGGGFNFGLARYNLDGSLDDSFSFDGKAATDFAGGQDIVFAVAIQADRKIVVAGQAFNGADNDFALARYNPDGALDTSFGVGGKVLTDFANSDDIAYGVAIQADGKIVAAGETSAGGQPNFAVARYNTDGTLDADFDADGKLFTDFAGIEHKAFDLAVQADGRILVVGHAWLTPADSDFALARYNLDGSLDSSFGAGGKVLTDFLGSVDGARSVAIQSDGRMVVAGSAFNGVSTDFALARYHPNGSLDADFEANGKLITDFAGDTDLANDVAIQADGKIVAVGHTLSGDDLDFGLARYYPDGALDNDFSIDGKVVTDFGDGGSAASVAIQADGKIVAAGLNSAAFDDFALARYLGDSPAAPPAVESVVVNDGSAQRSMVTSLTVTFSGVVDLDPGAFELLDQGVDLVGLQVETSTVGGQTVAVLTFVGADIVGGSLADGDYRLMIRGDRIHDSLGQALDGDGDGAAGGDRVDEFFRLFGDSDGDFDADSIDRDLFETAVGSWTGDAAYLAFFDFDGDGRIDRDDRKEFNRRFSKK